MRRLAKLSVVIAVAAVAALLIATVAQGSDSYQFDVIFDDARGLISGQEVKIAGAEAGTISNVVVTANDQARVEATITGPFQFHTDASCTIRPDGLIAENYLDCDPGSTSKPLLKGEHGEAPTVPVSHTSEPVSLQDLFDIFNLPTRERFQVLVDELGIATAGNGGRINSILRRANPTLVAAQRLIGILDTQTSQISTAISATNELAREGATHTAAIRSFLQQASGLTQLTANHSSSLEQAIQRLPAFLAAIKPALAQLNSVATTGTPLLSDLHAAAPSLNRINRDIVPFTKLAQPALAHLGSAVSTVDPDVKTLTPVIKTISNYLQASKSSTASFSKLLTNLIQHGFSENFLSVLYYVAGALGKEDSNSHVLSSLLVFPGNGSCGTYATTQSTNPACVAHYGSGSQSQSPSPDRAKRKATRTRRTSVTKAQRSSAAPTQTTSSAPSTASAPATATTPASTATTPALQSLLNYLLK